MTKKPRNKGFLLVEAMISITILLMVSATAITLLIYANHAIRFNAHSLEASWIAQEGINGVRGLRDTNWIRYSYDKEACWDAISDACDGTRMLPGVYRLETSLTDPPQLILASAQIDLENQTLASNDDYRIYKDETDGSLSHDSTDEETIYYRSVEIIQNTGDRIDATVTVAWLESNNKQKTIQLPIILTNYQLEE
ncbi:hypothetical protein ACFL3T_02420 [Patescibacteria group bacterium]